MLTSTVNIDRCRFTGVSALVRLGPGVNFIFLFPTWEERISGDSCGSYIERMGIL